MEQKNDRITVADFQLTTCQLSLYTPDEETSAAKILKGLLPKWDKLFDAEPLVLPTAAGVPRELPKLVLRSTDENWRCEVASGRFNIVWDSRNLEHPPALSEVVTKALPFLKDYREFVRCRTGRLAAVVNRYVLISNPGVFLAKHFCQPRWLDAPLNRPASFELHAHKRYAFPLGYDVNSWVRNKTAVLTVGSKPVVVVEQDLNTLPEKADTQDFDNSQVETFFVTALSEFDNILSLYYPAPDA